MKWRMKQLAIVLLVLFFFTACNNTKKDTDVIKIGAILPLTGKWALIGESEMVGLQVALDSLKIEFPDREILLIVEDFQSDIKNSVSAANKLISLNKVDAIITSTTAAAEAVSAVIEKNRIIHFTITPDLEILNRSDYNFRIFYNFRTEGNLINQFLIDNKIKSISFWGIKYTAVQRTINEIIIPKIKKNNIEVIDSVYYDTKEVDFKNSIIRLKNNPAQVVYLIPHVDQVTNISKQMKEYNFEPDGNIYFITSYTYNWVPDLDFSIIENFIICTPVSQINTNNKYFELMQEKNKKVKPNFDMMYAYDNLKVLVTLLINSNKDYDIFLESFNSMGEYNGASGKISFTGNRDTDVEIVLTKVQNGKQVILN